MQRVFLVAKLPQGMIRGITNSRTEVHVALF